MKVALCYFGLVRGFKLEETFESHQEMIYNALKEDNIDFSVYVSTYFDKDYDETNLNKIPNLVKISKKSDKTVSNEIIKQISDCFTCPHYFTKEHKTNLLKCWFSQQDLYNLLKNKKYDLVIVMDIGQKIISRLDNLNNLDKDRIYVPNFAQHRGYCGRMVIGNYKNIMYFLNKYNYLMDRIEKDKDKTIDIHPETFYKTYLQKENIPIGFLSVKFWRCRTDGTLIKDV